MPVLLTLLPLLPSYATYPLGVLHLPILGRGKELKALAKQTDGVKANLSEREMRQRLRRAGVTADTLLRDERWQ